MLCPISSPAVCLKKMLADISAGSRLAPFDRLIASGKLETRHTEGRVIVLIESCDRYLDGLPTGPLPDRTKRRKAVRP